MTSEAITPMDRCLILASDGVWQFLSSQEAMDVVYTHRDKGATAACRELIAVATELWHVSTDGEYRDDITAIVVFLPCFGSAGGGGE